MGFLKDFKFSKSQSKKIRDSARGECCSLRIEGVCKGDSETVVFCHAPFPNRGGMRAHDFWGAYGCSSCHDYVDRRNYRYADQAEINESWLIGIHETQEKLFSKGLL